MEQKNKQQKMSVYFPPVLLERVRTSARIHRRSFNQEALWLIEQGLEQTNDFDTYSILIEDDTTGGLTITTCRAIVLSAVEGDWTLIDVNGCKKCLYDPERLVVHGSVDKEHWVDLADERGRLFAIDPGENIMGVRYIRVRRKEIDAC